MDIKRIYMPDGKVRTYFRGDHQTWAEIVLTKILPDWCEYCNDHWISSNHEDIYAPEKRVKAFLDRCGWMLIQDNPAGLESDYKAMSHKVREIPVSECPANVSDYFYSEHKPPIDSDESNRFEALCEKLDEKGGRSRTQKKKPKIESKFERIEKLFSKNKNANRTWCSVDAENNFYYLNRKYHIPFGVSGYNDSTEAMDRILIIDDGNTIQYFDQNVYPITI